MLGNPRNMLSAILVHYFSAKPFRPCLRDHTRTEQCDDAKLKSSAHTRTHAPPGKEASTSPRISIPGQG